MIRFSVVADGYQLLAGQTQETPNKFSVKIFLDNDFVFYYTGTVSSPTGRSELIASRTNRYVATARIKDTTMNLSLVDKVAIVTGAARGIGRAIALTFAQEGSNLVVDDIVFSTYSFW